MTVARVARSTIGNDERGRDEAKNGVVGGERAREATAPPAVS